jgi:hypothetical protein
MLVEKPNGGSVYFQATNLSDTMLALVLERKISLQNKARHHTEFTTKRPPLLFRIRFIRSSITMPASTSIVEYRFECDVLSRLEIFIRFVIGLDRELALLQTDTTTIRTRQQLSRADQNFRFEKEKNVELVRK